MTPPQGSSLIYHHRTGNRPYHTDDPSHAHGASAMSTLNSPSYSPTPLEIQSYLNQIGHQ